MKIDYDAGDLVVALDSEYEIYHISEGSIYLCVAIRHEGPQFKEGCKVCGDREHEVIIAGIPQDEEWALCPCGFRKWHGKVEDIEQKEARRILEPVR